MTINLLAQLSDPDLIETTVRVAGDERRVTADLLALLGEVDARRLYLSEGCSSLFSYCTTVLRFSEHEAYHRIEAARAARQFPVILDEIRDGSLTLTAVTLLRPHLTSDNSEALIAAARHKTRREIEHQMASLAPKPDAISMIRRLPESKELAAPLQPSVSLPTSEPARPAEPRPVSAPLSSDRYLLRVTLTAEAHAKLRKAQDLLRHSTPDGDPAEVIDRALTLLVADLERRRMASVKQPRASRNTNASSRHVPAAVRRAVWSRDGGRCAFVGRQGRCAETGQLECHHVHPFALGGATTADNLELRCRAHNQHEGRLVFGDAHSLGNTAKTRPGPS